MRHFYGGYSFAVVSARLDIIFVLYLERGYFELCSVQTSTAPTLVHISSPYFFPLPRIKSLFTSNILSPHPLSSAFRRRARIPPDERPSRKSLSYAQGSRRGTSARGMPDRPRRHSPPPLAPPACEKHIYEAVSKPFFQRLPSRHYSLPPSDTREPRRALPAALLKAGVPFAKSTAFMSAQEGGCRTRCPAPHLYVSQNYISHT